MFKMLIRILNTLRSRRWDMVVFLFSSTLNLQVSITLFVNVLR
ncbi:hypothetical protein [Anaerobutyricum soehngenii]|nr:hypothetical protein [Anaerobutyricum soehngenii]